MGAVLLIATLDTKAEEAFYLKKEIERNGCSVLLANTGVFLPCEDRAEVKGAEIVKAGCGLSIEELKARKDKGFSIRALTDGIRKVARGLYDEGKIDAVISIGGAQGTDIGTAAMRELPFGVPKFMVSTVASGRATFGAFTGTKDVIMMHSVCDIQGLNVVTRKVFENAAAAVAGMVKAAGEKKAAAGTGQGRDSGQHARNHHDRGAPGQGAHRGRGPTSSWPSIRTGRAGIAMEEMIQEGLFKGVLDINLHEIGDGYFGGLHGSIRPGRLESAGRLGLPQVIAPGSVNYMVQGPYAEVSAELKKRKHIIHNSFLTLMRLTPEELREVGRITAEKINLSRGPVHVYIPRKGFSYPDTEGREHWEPEGNEAFIASLKAGLRKDIPYDEFDLHINDPDFIDRVVGELLRFVEGVK